MFLLDKNKNKIVVLVLFVLTMLMVVLNNYSSIENLISRWMREDEYGYGLIAFFAFFYFIYESRSQLLADSFQARLPGLFFFLVGVLLGVIGDFSSSFYIGQIATLCCFFGLSLLIFSFRSFWLIVGIFFVLFLAVPLPYTLQAMLTVKLQLVSTWLGVFFIDVFGIPVYMEGNVIDLGVYKLQVAEACSGLQYLYSLVCLAYIVAFLHDGSVKARASIVLFSIPLAILLNGFRIAVVGLLTNYFGVEAAEGFIHIFQGWVVFSIGIFFILLFSYIVGGLGQDSPVACSRETSSQAGMEGGNFDRCKIILAVAIMLTLFPLFLKNMGDRAQEALLRSDLVDYPTVLGNWHGLSQRLSDVELSILKPSDYSLVVYRSDEQKMPVEFYVVYYDSMDKGLSIHSPRVCLLGDGWEFDSFSTRSVDFIREGEQLRVNRVVIRRGDAVQLLYYWYQQRGRIFGSEFLMKWYLFVDSLLYGRKDGALVRFSTVIHTSETVTDGEARLISLMSSATGLLPKYIPE